MPRILLLGDIGWRARDGRARGIRRGSATFAIVYEAQAGTGIGVLGGRGVKGERSREAQRFLPGLGATSPGTGGLVSPRGTRGPRPSLELHWRDTASRDISPAVPGHPKTQKISSDSCSQSWGWRTERGPLPRPPRAASAYSPASGRARGRLSLRTDRSRSGARPLPFARSALAPPPGGGTRGRAGISGRPS